MQQHGNKYFYRQTPPPSPWGVVSNFNFIRTWSVANQIKWNHKCSIIVAIILPVDPPPPPPPLHTLHIPSHPGPEGWTIIRKNLNVVMLHIKLRGKKEV